VAAANPEQSSYSDPFAYCAAVGTVDAPDGRYNGLEMPDAVVQGLIQQGVVSADAPAEFQKHAVWRCMDGQVWVCHFGANLPCQEKADTSQVPTSELEAFCKENLTADSIPAAVTGRATVYEWECSAGKPQVVRQVFQVDSQGYLADFWYELTPQGTDRSALGKWQTHTNTEAGFTMQVPPTWSWQTLPDQNNGAIHGEVFTGPEGGVEIYWGVGFGGACPTGRDPVKLAEVVATACHVTSSDGIDIWNQIDYVVSGGNAFSNRASTSNTPPSSHDLVLQVLSTLAFTQPS